MICKGCGEEFDSESYDVCPFCLLPWQDDEQGTTVPEGATVALCETEDIPAQSVEMTNAIIREESCVQEDAALEPVMELTQKDIVIDKGCEHTTSAVDYSRIILADVKQLSVRSKNALALVGIATLADLIGFLENNDLYNIPRIGATSVANITAFYESMISCDGHGEIISPSTAKTAESIAGFESLNIKDLQGLNVRSINCLNRVGVNTFADLIKYLHGNDLRHIRGIGAGTVENILTVYEDVLGKGQSPVMETIESKLIGDINPGLKPLTLTTLADLGMSRHFVNQLIGRCESIGDLELVSNERIKKACTADDWNALEELNRMLQLNIVDVFRIILEKYVETAQGITVIKRAKGYTLAEIGKSMGLTRERIRQYEARFVDKQKQIAESVFEIIRGDRKYIAMDEILDLYEDDRYDYLLVRLCQLSDSYEYLDFADMFVKRNPRNRVSIENAILDVLKEIIGEVADVEEVFPEIEQSLLSIEIDYLDIEAIRNLLKKNGYCLYGNYAKKGGKSYAGLLVKIVGEEFPNGIHTNQDNNREEPDLKRLREIVEERFPGAHIAENDRALTARLADYLIECGRGMLTVKENISFEESVFEDIFRYIEESPYQKVYFGSLFEEFSGALTATSNIDSRFFLHGVMTWLYPDAYIYSRDYLEKKTGNHSNKLADRLVDCIRENGGPMHKAEIKKAIPGMSDIMIFMRVSEDKRLLPWKFGYYTVTEMFEFTEGDISVLKSELDTLLSQNYGYCNAILLYNRMKEVQPELLSKNCIDCDYSMGYFASFVLDGKYDFYEKHIAEKDRFEELTTLCVMQQIIGTDNEVSRSTIMKLATQFGWPIVTAEMVFSKFISEYIRISDDIYVPMSKFSISSIDVQEIEKIIEKYQTYGVVPLAAVEDFIDMPEIGFSWNPFLLQSVIEHFGQKYKLIHRTNSDRRFIRSIAVDKESEFTSFDQVIAYYLKKENIHVVSEGDLLGILASNYFVHKVIPIELKMSSFFKYEDGIFAVL